mmetsp:Transcript_21902/g.49988  ORF Transcript_21902/g.49988 Transcript_21902/m.49988 type:complete len:845 (+) Transcript_21902:94-2628(+)
MAQASVLAVLLEKESALKNELQVVQEAIKAEEQRLAQVKDRSPGPASIAEVPASVELHKRPSWSLLGGDDDDVQEEKPMLRQLSPTDFEAVLAHYPPVEVSPIGGFNHWDRRECAVANKDAWRSVCENYMRNTLRGAADIPKMIHMIWVGPKEPPCLWMDTFRVDYLAANPEWGFTLWSDEQVSRLPMFNEQMYREEKMWQCKADILRLEILWHHGGLYVDADMISVENKSLNPVLELAKETGFAIAYEPDTKDKPYSILGNSVIAATPHHPLVLMLILYLKNTYYHKRPHIDVFMVTGPTMYTKCLVDSGMPISVPPQEWFYPAFHYVPNPDAIDLARFPKCLMFQFGYTCSGLEGYVKRKNKCKKARECPHHSKKEWPLGPFRCLPVVDQLQAQFEARGGARNGIPRVIHQLVYNGVDSENDPLRWRQSWWGNFKRCHPEFEYKAWSREQLKGRDWFCANLYTDSLDDAGATALMLEVLFNEGGYYVPLATTFNSASADAFFSGVAPTAGLIEAAGGIFAATPGSPACYQRLMDIYHRGVAGPVPPLTSAGPKVNAMNFRDGVMCNLRFPRGTKFLGTERLVAFSMAGGSLEQEAVGMAYECQVPCSSARGQDGLAVILAEPAKVMIVTDGEFFNMMRLREELPGLVANNAESSWDILLFGCEWHTGSDEVALFRVPQGGRPAHCQVAGVCVNLRDGRNTGLTRQVMQDAVGKDGFDPKPLFDAAGRLSLWFAAEKYAGSLEQAKIFRAMPAIAKAFQALADHHPPMHFDRHEIHGNLMKGFQYDRLRFEMMVEPNGGSMFRAWNDDNSTNCEMKSTGGNTVEWMKIYADHQVRHEFRDKTF